MVMRSFRMETVPALFDLEGSSGRIAEETDRIVLFFHGEDLLGRYRVPWERGALHGEREMAGRRVSRSDFSEEMIAWSGSPAHRRKNEETVREDVWEVSL